MSFMDRFEILHLQCFRVVKSDHIFPPKEKRLQKDALRVVPLFLFLECLTRMNVSFYMIERALRSAFPVSRQDVAPAHPSLAALSQDLSPSLVYATIIPQLPFAQSFKNA
jgi:hypothetical protein